MNTHVVFRCTTPTCTAELRVPRADVDRYGPAWTCDACRDEHMAEWLLARQHREYQDMSNAWPQRGKE